MPNWIKKAYQSELWRFLFFVVFIILPIRLFVIQPFIVSGESMFPTFENRDYLIVDAISYKFEKPKRGDVVVFKYPYDNTRYFIKRIVGLPGETVRIDNGKVFINDTQLDEPYAGKMTENNFSIKLATDELFVMGDNRPASSDSRSWGPLQEKYLVGRPLIRLYPIPEIGILPGHI